MKIVIAILSFTVLMVQARAHSEHHHASGEMPSGQPLLSESVYNLGSTWVSQDAKEIKIADLRGKPTVVAMTYTSCEAACPLIIEDMRKIAAGLGEKERGQFAFVIFSFDSERDTPEKMKAFASKKKLDASKWTLLRGDAKAVRELAAVLGIRYKKEKSGDFDHSNVISLLDAEGRIKHQQNGLNQDPKEFLAKTKTLE